MPTSPPTLQWIGNANGHLRMIDQTKLPIELVEIDCTTVEEVWQAIKRLSVRGAPAIGVAAAYGVCLAAKSESQTEIEKACDYLATSRPTAVNLFWALDRMRAVAQRDCRRESLLAEARAIHEEDAQMCLAIGRNGADLLAPLFKDANNEPVGILTHCNAGALATGGEGTALSVIFELARRRSIHVWVDETRPLLQGSRLTAWELTQRGIPCTLICDNMAGHVMQQGRVQAVVTGADRIAANGDA
ncbi:MAG: S-methyl-5-thioribose-1-phosphate isomerase, partial [Lacipirellulaceae bacterium]